MDNPNNQKNNGRPGGPKKGRGWVILPYILIPIALVIGVMYASSTTKKVQTEYYQIVQYFDQDKVDAFKLNITSGALEYKLEGEDSVKKYTVPNVSVFLDDVNETVREHNKNAKTEDDMIKYEYTANSSSWILNLLPSFIIGAVCIIMLVVMMRRMNSAGSDMNRTLNFGKARVKTAKDNKKKTTFEQVAGADEEKEELSEMVDFLKNPSKFSALGARIPKGVLLVGPPGTGKTLLARAVAGEADVPFFSISGSDFVEMYVGVGASRVRDLFDKAKKDAPSVIFIDEIDAVGRHRGAGMGGGHDEREQTLNQLLVEMDGFGANEGVIMIAATNRPDILDPALMRPGRFDRRVPVELPDLAGREAILKVHAKKIKTADNVDFHTIARMASGASGAELANIVNEAALRAVRAGRRFATESDLEESIEVVIAGYQKKNAILTDHEKWIVAYHETGHALVAALQSHSAPVQKITIIPRTSGALGYTMQVEEGNHYLMTREEMENKIATLTGGRAAEEVRFGSVTTGASNDIEQATKLARAMVTRYGMSADFDMVALETVTNQYLGGDASLACSAETQTKIDALVVALVKREHEKAVKLLNDHRSKLDELSKYLYEKETITGEEFMKILNLEKAQDKTQD